MTFLRTLELLKSLRRALVLSAVAVGLAACQSTPPLNPSISRGASAYETFEVSGQQASIAEYRIGPLDTLEVSIFQEPELSSKDLKVDSAGNIAMPWIGAVPASGKTTRELATVIASKYRGTVLKNPQVSVNVLTSSSQRVTVQGEVREPGVFEIKGGTTLLQTIALAKGETPSSKLNEVVVFRTINGQRMGAVFDVRQIRSGNAADPIILGNDIVIVGFSSARKLWGDLLSTTPILNIFRPVF